MLLQYYSLIIYMIRDKSKSKLSTGASKSKVKQAFRVAMGKTPQKQKDKIIDDIHPRRSLSSKNVRTNNYSEIQIGRPSLYSGIKRGNSQKVISNNYMENVKLSTINDRSSQLVKFQLDSFEWWHKDGYQIQTQSKISQVNGKKSFMKYFAFYEKKKTRKCVLVAIEDDSLYIGNSELTIYLIDALNNQIESINAKAQKINLYEVGSRKILIVGNNNERSVSEQSYKQYSIKSFISGVKCNSILEKVILQQINTRKSKFFQGLIQKASESQLSLGKFYLCLDPKPQPKIQNMASQIMRKISQVQKQTKPQKQKTMTANKANFISNIKISQQALLRFKR